MRVSHPLASLVSSFVAGQILFACASTSEETPASPTETPDATPEASPQIEAGSDAGSEDARAVDAAAPKPLDVACEIEPCYVAISGSGSQHLCALLKDKTVRCWGRDGIAGTESDRALGRGAAASPIEGATAAPVVGIPGPVDRVRVGPNLGTCVRTVDGAVYCWGRNDRGQLGSPPAQARLTSPTRIEGLPPVDDIALGFTRGCATTAADHALYCWGTDAKETFEEPHLMKGFSPPVKALAIATLEDKDTVVTLLEGNILAATGSHAPYGDSHFPTDPVLRSNVTRITTFAIANADGAFWRWLPIEEKLFFPAPVVDLKIFGNRNADFEVLDQPGGAVMTSGRLFRWGRNGKGELGSPPTSLRGSKYPVEVLQVRNKVVTFAMATQTTCALLVDGKITCFGANGAGELGRGSVDFAMHPEPELIR